MRKDAVFFLNCGDSYMSGGGASRHFGYTDPKYPAGRLVDYPEPMTFKHAILKPKDLCLIPQHLAIRLQEDGWWVRSVIIWSKNNPMPESCKDRPSESHEYILMLTKSAKYYWDAEAVREPYQPDSLRPTKVNKNNPKGMDRQGVDDWLERQSTGRNLRDVWEFSTQPYPEAHFATFPEKLPEICIKAATPEVGCCSKCGKSWERITERQTADTRPGRKVGAGKSGTNGDPNQALHQSDLSKYRQQIGYETIGWQVGCHCERSDKIPSLVLDPFAGTGTVGWVAKKLGRKAVLYELSEEYCKLALERNRQQALGI